MTRLIAAAMGLAGVIGVFVLLVWVRQRKLIYFPFDHVPRPDTIGLSSAAPVTFQTADGLMLNGWFVQPAGTAWLTVIVFNGNGGNRAMRAPLAGALTRQGIAVLLFDYRGYGGNPGTPTERGLIADARAARDYLLAYGDVDPKRIAYFGESLGAAVAVQLAAAFPPTALVLRSPFDSLAAVGRFHYPLLPVRWLLRDRFASREFIARVRSPLLVIVGERDRIVPPSHSRRLFEAAHDPKTFAIMKGADHNDASLLDGKEMVARVVEFLRHAANREKARCDCSHRASV